MIKHLLVKNGLFQRKQQNGKTLEPVRRARKQKRVRKKSETENRKQSSKVKTCPCGKVCVRTLHRQVKRFFCEWEMEFRRLCVCVDVKINKKDAFGNEKIPLRGRQKVGKKKSIRKRLSTLAASSKSGKEEKSAQLHRLIIKWFIGCQTGRLLRVGRGKEETGNSKEIKKKNYLL